MHCDRVTTSCLCMYVGKGSGCERNDIGKKTRELLCWDGDDCFFVLKEDGGNVSCDYRYICMYVWLLFYVHMYAHMFTNAPPRPKHKCGHLLASSLTSSYGLTLPHEQQPVKTSCLHKREDRKYLEFIEPEQIKPTIHQTVVPRFANVSPPNPHHATNYHHASIQSSDEKPCRERDGYQKNHHQTL
jgi:hypothetical protein